MYYKAGAHKQAGLTYSPFKALIAPRPIGWISTCDAQGHANLAPYSFFNAISEIPPMVMFVSAPDARAKTHNAEKHQAKDSLRNIVETGEFGVNIVGHKHLQDMINSSDTLPPQEDEFIAAGLSKMNATDISPPLVADAPANLECELHDIIDLPGTNERAGCKMVLGRVLSIHIDDEVIKDGLVDVSVFQPAARLGYKDYTLVKDVFAARIDSH